MLKFIDQAISARATTRSGRTYESAHIKSATHILDISAELAVLILAVHHNDPDVVSVETVTDESAASVSPLVLKLLVDHGTRTGTTIHYTLRTKRGELLLEADDARVLIPFYTPHVATLASLAARSFSPAKITAQDISDEIEVPLRDAARAGITRNFPTYENASGYGASLRTTDGTIYFGGQYSTPDHRAGAHAEMAVLIHALLDGATGFTHLALASSKFKDTPASPCGCCRQLLAEVARETKSDIRIHLFASETDATTVHTIDELLPILWINRA